MKANKSHKDKTPLYKKLLLLISTLVILMLLGEVVASLALPAPPRQDPNFYPFEAHPNPQIQYQLQPGSQGWWHGTPMEINSQGRRDQLRSKDKPEDVFRIAVIGDSDTFGMGERVEDTYPYLLQTKLNQASSQPKFQVLNFAVPGYNTVQEAALLKERVLAYQPDLLIVGYVLNDAAAIAFFRSQEGKEAPPQRPVTLQVYEWLLQNSSLALWLKTEIRNICYQWGVVNNLRKDFHLKLYEKDNPGWLANQQALAEIARLAKEREIPVVMVIIPMLVNLDNSYPYKEIHRKVAKVAKDLNMPVLDLFPFFKGLSEAALHTNVAYDAHPNEKAHRIMARACHEFLKDKELVVFDKEKKHPK